MGLSSLTLSISVQCFGPGCGPEHVLSVLDWVADKAGLYPAWHCS